MKRAVLMLAVCLCLAACHCERRTNGIPCRKAVRQAQQCQADCLKCPCMQAVAQEAARTALKEQEEFRKAERERIAAEKARQEAAKQQEKEFSQMADVRRHETGKVVVNYKNPIRFAWNSDTILRSSNNKLTQTANILRKYPNHHITVVGYTDSTGDPLYNQDLSERRAKAVADALIRKGVPEQNVSYKGMGASHFIRTNKTSKGRAANRRVELEISAK